MKFKVSVSELRYGFVEVEADSEEEAKAIAAGKDINYVDSEITDMTAEQVQDKKAFMCDIVLEKHFRVKVEDVCNPRDAHVKAMLQVLDHEKEMDAEYIDARTEKVEEL